MKPIIILVETQLAVNLGAVARSMANFGLTDLRLINPKISPTDSQAIATSAGASTILHQAEVFEDFEAAMADLKYVFATTACQRDMIKTYETPKSFVKLIAHPKFQANSIGVVFGPERTGLLNDHIARCYKAITIPVNPDFSSLNLAQAVSIIAYEWYESLLLDKNTEPQTYLGETRIACQVETKAFLNFLETQLDQTNFWRVKSKKPVMWRNLVNFFSKIEFTQQDLKTLYGVIDTLRKNKNH